MGRNKKAFFALSTSISLALQAFTVAPAFATTYYEITYKCSEISSTGEVLSTDLCKNIKDVTNENAPFIKKDVKYEDFLKAPSWGNHTFQKWVDKNGKNVTGKAKNNIVITALFEKPVEIPSHNLTYILNGGEISGNTTVSFKENESLTLATPEKLGHNFDGWFTTETFEEGTKILEIAKGTEHDVTVYAKWTPSEYKINYHLNLKSDDTNNSKVNPSSYTYGVGANITTNVTRPGQKLENWYTSNSLKEKHIFNGTISEEDYGEKTLFAKWVNAEYTLTIDDNNGSAEKNITYTIDSETMIFKAPVREGYEFFGYEVVAADEDTTYSVGDSFFALTKGSYGNFKVVAKWHHITTLTADEDTITEGDSSCNFSFSFDNSRNYEIYLNDVLVDAENIKSTIDEDNNFTTFLFAEEYLRSLKSGVYHFTIKDSRTQISQVPVYYYTLNVLPKEEEPEEPGKGGEEEPEEPEKPEEPEVPGETPTSPDTGVETKAEAAVSTYSLAILFSGILAVLGFAIAKEKKN